MVLWAAYVVYTAYLLPGASPRAVTEAWTAGRGHQVGARPCTQLGDGIAHVRLHRLLGDPQLGRDFRVGLTERDPADDLGLASREDAGRHLPRSPEVRTPTRCGQRYEQHEPAAGGDLGTASGLVGTVPSVALGPCMEAE